MDRAVWASSQFREHTVPAIHDGVQGADGHVRPRPHRSIATSGVHDGDKRELEPTLQKGTPDLACAYAVVTVDTGQDFLDLLICRAMKAQACRWANSFLIRSTSFGPSRGLQMPCRAKMEEPWTAT